MNLLPLEAYAQAQKGLLFMNEACTLFLASQAFHAQRNLSGSRSNQIPRLKDVPTVLFRLRFKLLNT